MDLKGGGGSSRNPEAMKDTPSPPHPWAATTLGFCSKAYIGFFSKQYGTPKSMIFFYWISNTDDVWLLTLFYFLVHYKLLLYVRQLVKKSTMASHSGGEGCVWGRDKHPAQQCPSAQQGDASAPGRESLSTLQHNYLVFT